MTVCQEHVLTTCTSFSPFLKVFQHLDSIWYCQLDLTKTGLMPYCHLYVSRLLEFRMAIQGVCILPLKWNCNGTTDSILSLIGSNLTIQHCNEVVFITRWLLRLCICECWILHYLSYIRHQGFPVLTYMY